MKKNIETYIVWFKKEFEVAGKAAEALNGQVICYPSNDESLTDKIGCKLAELGYSANLISAIVPVAEYVRMENDFAQNFHSENWPSKDLNLFAAAVSVEHSVEDQCCADLLHLLRNKDDVEASFEDYVEELTGKDLQWVYGRNRDAVNLWLAESRTDFFDLLETQENLAEVVTVLWAKAVLGKFFDKYGRNNPSSEQLEADESVSAQT